LIATAVLLTLAIGLRNQVGGDWYNYLFIFRVVSRMDLLDAMIARGDPGFVLVNWIGAKAGWGVWFPNLVCAAIFTWGLFSFARQQPNPALAIAASTYIIVLVAMGVTRQSAALGFVMLAIVQYARGAMVRTGIYLLCAALFHTSAIIMAPIIALAAVRRGPGTAIAAMILAALVTYQLYAGLSVLVSRYTEHITTSEGAVPRLLMNLIPALIYFTIPSRITKDPADRALWTIMSLMTFLSLLLLFVIDSSTIVDRLGFYLTPLQIYVLSRLPAALGVRSRENMFVLSLILAFSLTIEIIWLRYGTWGHAWLPYRNYLWDASTGKVPPRWYREAM